MITVDFTAADGQLSFASFQASEEGAKRAVAFMEKCKLIPSCKKVVMRTIEGPQIVWERSA